MQGAGLRQEPAPLLQEIGDVLAGVRAQGVRVLDGAGGRLRAEDLGEGDDLDHMMARIDAALVQVLVVGLGLRRQPQELEQDALIARLLPVVDQFRRVLGLLDVLVAVERTQMLRARLADLLDDHGEAEQSVRAAYIGPHPSRAGAPRRNGQASAPSPPLSSLSDYLDRIAKLGGYLGRANDPPPGNIVMWRG